jgi:hypothetical protein
MMTFREIRMLIQSWMTGVSVPYIKAKNSENPFAIKEYFFNSTDHMAVNLYIYPPDSEEELRAELEFLNGWDWRRMFLPKSELERLAIACNAAYQSFARIIEDQDCLVRNPSQSTSSPISLSETSLYKHQKRNFLERLRVKSMGSLHQGVKRKPTSVFEIQLFGQQSMGCKVDLQKEASSLQIVFDVWGLGDPMAVYLDHPRSLEFLCTLSRQHLNLGSSSNNETHQ